jgi:acyl-coenzyme A synthetase/AMP-(fatty) acid ligase
MGGDHFMKLIWLFQCTDAAMRERIAFVTPARSYTHGEIGGAAARLIRRLGELGVRRGQRVVLIPEHDENALVFLAAASAIGLQVVMPYNLNNAALSEWTGMVDTVVPDHVICLKRDGEVLQGLRAAGADPIALTVFDGSAIEQDLDIVVDCPDPVENFLVLFTSGTTGKAKAVSVSEALVCTRVATVSARLKFSADARILMTGLMNNTTGVIFSFGALLHDATLVFPGGRVIENWPRQVDNQRITHMMLRPIALRRFIDGARASGADLSSLRVLAYGAAALPKPLLEEGRAMMRCEWVQGYGLSETFGPFCWLTEEDHLRRLYERHVYCVGKPDGTLEVTLRYPEGQRGGVGEVMLRGASLMQGYIDFASNTVQPVEEFFATGDFGELAPSGELILKGRMANTIMSANGHRIYPEEVESVVAGIDGVTEVVLLNAPSPNNLGSSPIACIHGALAERQGPEVRAIVIERLKHQLSEEKWPDYLFMSRDPFPKSANDKLIKPAVLAMIEHDALIRITSMESIQ